MQNPYFLHRNQPVADDGFDMRQRPLDIFLSVHDLNNNRQVMAQLQYISGMNDAPGSITEYAA